ncbi:MAG: serine/threonine-protein kinase [candidate division Zixibacteria bacterium]|nr:serine/threonine-protein kinase [candidate division Zixibacteria bacterium]MDH3938122.1 serine/threonine-protein kinase [candidate division Zixibacteria bacterium]MDH4033512.1 serine/threonine-protein kinase [candidate division Zixibacteria bacterium]
MTNKPEPYFDLRPGMTLGRNYFVVEFLGSGWEGEVYKVEERRTGILRAAKVFYEGRRLTDRQLKRYAKKLHKLRHCPIITQYHHRDMARVGREQVEILVSDLGGGEMLSAFLERQPRKRLAPFEALHLLHSMAVGMEPIHFLGEYHGDIHSDNILVKRVGLTFQVRLLDFFDLGRPTREKMQYDVIDLVSLLYELIGGQSGYTRAGDEIRRIVMGRKHTLIRKRFKTAGQLRIALENIAW